MSLSVVPSINVFDKLRSDFLNIYSKDATSSFGCGTSYLFEGNKVTILFLHILNDNNFEDSVEIKMLKRDGFLERNIIAIVQDRTLLNTNPTLYYTISKVVKNIDISLLST